MPLNILIVGGGLGGLAAAAYLRKHHNVTVLERGNLDFTRNDYGISIIVNAYNLLQKLGIDEQKLAISKLAKVHQRTADNGEISTIDFNSIYGGGTPSVFTKRSRLQGELFRLATDPSLAGLPAKVHENIKVERIDAKAGSCHDQSGKEYSADFIIGADGINSVARSAVLAEDGKADTAGAATTHDLLGFVVQLPLSCFQKEPQLSFFGDETEKGGLCTWAPPAPTEEESKRGWSPHSKRRIVAYHTGLGEVQFVGYSHEKEFSEQFDQAQTTIIKNVPSSRAQADFPDFTDCLTNLFNYNKSAEGSVDAWRIRDIDPIDTWHNGRVLCIGDSAHAVTPHMGQGCNSAFEDAEALGFFLQDAQSWRDVEDALPKFMAIRKKRAQNMARISRQMGALLSKEEMQTELPLGTDEFQKETYGYTGAAAAWRGVGVRS